MHPFMARFLWLIARTLGCPPFRDDGGGRFKVLKVSNMFIDTNRTRNTGTIRAMVANERDGGHWSSTCPSGWQSEDPSKVTGCI